MKYTLIVKRYGIDNTFNFDTLKEAVLNALGQLEYELAFPYSIMLGNKLIWKFKNISGITAELKGLVKNET